MAVVASSIVASAARVRRRTRLCLDPCRPREKGNADRCARHVDCRAPARSDDGASTPKRRRARIRTKRSCSAVKRAGSSTGIMLTDGPHRRGAATIAESPRSSAARSLLVRRSDIKAAHGQILVALSRRLESACDRRGRWHLHRHGRRRQRPPPTRNSRLCTVVLRIWIRDSS
jgi:hypothetical protein